MCKFFNKSKQIIMYDNERDFYMDKDCEESTYNGVDFEMQELMTLENQKHTFKIFKKNYIEETKILGLIYHDTFVGTNNDFSKTEYYNNDNFQIEKSIHTNYVKEKDNYPYLAKYNLKFKHKGQVF